MCGDIEQCFAVAPASDFAVRAAKQMPAAVAMAVVASIGETARVCKKTPAGGAMASGRNAVGWTDALTRLAPAQAPAGGHAHSSAAGGAAWHGMTLQCALCHLQSITTRGLVPTAMYI